MNQIIKMKFNYSKYFYQDLKLFFFNKNHLQNTNIKNHIESQYFKIIFFLILILSNSFTKAQINKVWDTNSIQDSLVTIKINSLLDKNLWYSDGFENENAVQDKLKNLIGDMYMESINYKKSELIKTIENQTIYSYSMLTILIVKKNRGFWIKTILLFSRNVKYNLVKGEKNILFIMREPNSKESKKFNADALILRDIILNTF